MPETGNSRPYRLSAFAPARGSLPGSLAGSGYVASIERTASPWVHEAFTPMADEIA
jgi:hypothetical protein